MARIVTFDNCAIYVYAAGEHPPPHFHLRGPDTRLSIDIATLEITKGNRYARRDLQQALEWASTPGNRQILLDEWVRQNGRDRHGED